MENDEPTEDVLLAAALEAVGAENMPNRDADVIELPVQSAKSPRESAKQRETTRDDK